MLTPRTFIIAEAGVNHCGSLGLAMRLIDEAKKAGADAVKFQHFNSKRLWGDDRIAALELSDAQMADVAVHCVRVGIEFMCTPFGITEVYFLAPLVKRMKVASGCLERWGLLEAVRDTRLPVILSTGMADLPTIREAMITLGYDNPGEYKQRYTLLQCTSAYPCRHEDANLAAMDTLRHQYGDRCQVGFSDHTAGITIAIAAAARGAAVIEKHLTLDRTMEGPDHKASLEPNKFRVMVDAIRMIEAAIGDGVKRPRQCEAKVREQWYGDQR